jgi:hypothetical protein
MYTNRYIYSDKSLSTDDKIFEVCYFALNISTYLIILYIPIDCTYTTAIDHHNTVCIIGLDGHQNEIFRFKMNAEKSEEHKKHHHHHHHKSQVTTAGDDTKSQVRDRTDSVNSQRTNSNQEDLETKLIARLSL